MEKQHEFKPTAQYSTAPSTKGEALPVVKGLVESGLTEANSKGEANVTAKAKVKQAKTSKNPKGSGRIVKTRDKSYYPNHKFIEINNKVFIVLKPDSKLNLSNFTDFIHATEASEYQGDLVDILPPLHDEHFKLIANVNTRIMVGDKVCVDFKFRSINEVDAAKQKEYVKVVDVKFVNLGDMTAIVAYLENKDFYPINQLNLDDSN